jgi:hypothetical protein
MSLTLVMWCSRHKQEYVRRPRPEYPRKDARPTECAVCEGCVAEARATVHRLITTRLGQGYLPKRNTLPEIPSPPTAPP